ncbi:MAG: discoidin domain-containing protein [Spirochaetales bacterium]|nr:discoidin domain-containing protein [Spirochaetales bacterium]
MKKKWLLAALGAAVFGTFFSCNMGNNASVEAIESARSVDFVSPLAAAQLDFQPSITVVSASPVKACCWQRRRDPKWLLDGTFLSEPDGNVVGGYWDWAWDGTASWNNTPYQALSNGTASSEGESSTDWQHTWQITSANAKTGHADYFTGGTAGTPAHFVTFDLGEVKRNIFRIAYYPRGSAGRIAEYDIWISSNATSSDAAELRPEIAAGWTKAAHGTWGNSGWQYANFVTDTLSNGPVDARFVQIRSLADGDGTGSFEVGGREVKFDIAGDFDGTIDKSYLMSAYIRGVPLVSSAGNARSANIIKLEELLDDAKQLLFADIPENFIDKIELQRNIDNTAKELIPLVNSLSL